MASEAICVTVQMMDHWCIFMNKSSAKSALLSLVKSFTFWSVLLLILLGIGLVQDWHWLRGNDEYRWRYYSLPGMEERLLGTAVFCLLIGLLCILVILWARKAGSRGRVWLILGVIFLAAVALQLAILRLEHPDPAATLFYRTVSTRNLGAFYFDATTTTDMGQRLAQFPQLMSDFHSLSPRTHPPGLQVLFWGMGRLLERFPGLAERAGPFLRTYLCNDPAASPIFFYSNAVLSAAWLQMLMPLWGALSIFPFYGLARLLFDRQTAVRGAVLLILVPSMLLFAAHWAHFYTLLALLALFILYYGLVSGKWWPIFLSGLLVSLASFLSFSNVALAAMMGITLFVYWASTLARSGMQIGSFISRRWQPLLAQVIALSGGFVVTWLSYYLFFGVTFFEVYAQGLLNHTKITGYRTYSTWLGYNLFDFFLFLGIPLVLALGVMIAHQVKMKGAKQRLELQAIPFWSFLVTILALNLSGISKGEVARLWMFLMPLAVLAVLPVVKVWSRQQMALVIIVLVLQGLFMGYYIRTIGSTNYPFYEPRTVQADLPTGAEPLNVTFGSDETLGLRGYRIQKDNLAEGLIELELFWAAEQPLEHSYTVFAHLIDPSSGQIVAQHDSLPQEGQLPTLCWQTAEIVPDRHLIYLGPDVNTGKFQLHVGLYRLDLLQAGDPDHRLSVQPDGVETTFKVAEFDLDG